MSTLITKFFYSFFTFTGRAMWVEYGDPTIPSHSYWIIPGTWRE